MYLDLLQNTGVYPTRRFSVFHFAPLSDPDAYNSRTTTRVWDTLLERDSNPSMRGNANLFQDQGIPPIEYWSESKTTFPRFNAFIFTLLSDRHPVSNL